MHIAVAWQQRHHQGSLLHKAMHASTCSRHENHMPLHASMNAHMQDAAQRSQLAAASRNSSEQQRQSPPVLDKPQRKTVAKRCRTVKHMQDANEGMAARHTQ